MRSIDSDNKTCDASCECGGGKHESSDTLAGATFTDTTVCIVAKLQRILFTVFKIMKIKKATDVLV